MGNTRRAVLRRGGAFPWELLLANHRLLHPILKAYSLGLLSFLGPRVLSILFAKASRKPRGDQPASKTAALKHLLRSAVSLHRFPAFCGLLIGSSQLLNSLLAQSGHDSPASTFLACAVSAALGHTLLNSCSATGGRTLDLTFFAVVRAIDVVVGRQWERRKKRLPRRMKAVLENGIDAGAFALSSGIVMYAWLFFPERLPKQYQKWITGVAKVDQRLIDALRQIRNGEFWYEVERGTYPATAGEAEKGKAEKAVAASLEAGKKLPLCSYAKELGLPLSIGDPALSNPISCTIVHSGLTPSCLLHALHRFLISALTGLPAYLSLSLLPHLLSLTTPGRRALFSTLRSCTFLGTFVASFFYTICLVRSHLPYLPLVRSRVPQVVFERSMIAAACAVCGWSILWEKRARHKEFMFFVAPRAVAAVWPECWRSYGSGGAWTERAVFALAAGTVLAEAHRGGNVRGVFGKLLGRVMR